MGTAVDLKIFAEDVEDEAVKQIDAISSLDAFVGAKIRIMPDVHAGKGCVCGFTANLGEKVVPNLIGVDIGCGMLTVRLGRGDVDFATLDEVIRGEIPCGMKVHHRISDFTERGYADYGCDPSACIANFSAKDLRYFKSSVGTLGGGNHFIEVDENSNGEKYLVIHTGSRNFGKKVCEHWQEVAVKSLSKPIPNLKNMIKDVKIRCVSECHKERMQEAIHDAIERYNEIVRQSRPQNEDLAYLVGDSRDGYLHDMKIAQRYASLNRWMIAFLICRKMGWLVDGGIPGNFSTVHNYLGEDNIIRKSAISAKEGEEVLIPLNMRDGSLICVGKGNDDWNNSAPHGAGRRMSRRKAKETLNMDEFRNSMDGIFTTSVSEETIDESPFAYKDSDSIIRQISDTVEVVERIRPLYNFKASEV